MTTFSSQQKLEIAESLKSYFEDRKTEAKENGEKFSQNKLADLMGISSGQLGYIFDPEKHGTTNTGGNLMLTDKIWRKVQNFIGFEISVWDTANYTEVMNTFMECKLNAEQRIIDGSTGMGKSFPAEQFLKNFPANTYLVTCATDQNPKQFIYELAKAVGVKRENLGGSRYDLRVVACERLLEVASTGAKPLLIIDETENAKPAVIGSMKDCFDYKQLYRQVGIAVLGANGFVKTLEDKAQNKIKHAYPQFLRRFGSNPVFLQDYSAKEARSICNLYDIDNEAKKYIVTTAQNLGHLNNLIKRYLADKELFKAKMHVSPMAVAK